MIRANLVLTIIGPDRPGLIEAVASVIADHDGNWVESRMARLAGQFAGILLVDVPRDAADAVRASLTGLESQGLRLSVEQAEVHEPEAATASMLRFELLGHDRPGIVRQVSRALAQRHVNVVDLVTEVFSAPMTGDPLFRAAVEATMPGDADTDELRAALERVAEELSMDLTFD